jgi:DNA mismatch repair protein MutS2
VSMDFAVGMPVLVVTLKRHGEVVERRGRHYRVAIGGLTLTCRQDDLRPIETSRADTRKKSHTRIEAVPSPRAEVGSVLREPVATTSIDLHGMTTQEAREAVLRHLDQAMREGRATVEVLHGIGTGKVRAAVRQVLAEVPSVRHVRPHPTNPGVTVVDL